MNTVMKFEKRNFMGIELDVLVGHPEHELLFIALQVGKAAGLLDGSKQAQRIASEPDIKWIKAREALGDNLSSMKPKEIHAPTWHKMYLFPEATVYTMLLRGHAPQSGPFRKWVTEEVLPTIRKTGSYNAEESTNPIALGVMDELKLLRSDVASLREFIVTQLSTTYGPVVPAVKSPYEGVTKGTVHYHKDLQAIREAGETLRMSAPVVDRLIGNLLIQLEKTLITKWRSKDTRTLDCEFSVNGGRNWTLWPMNFLKANLMHTHYVDALAVVMNEKMTK